MKTILLLMVVSVSMLALGCSSSQETRLAEEPRTYDEAMTWIRLEVVQIDKHVIGSQYDEAVPDAERLKNYTRTLSGFEPPRLPDNWELYDEYFAEVSDLHHASDRLLYFIQQRRKEDAKDQLAEVAKRYNRISTTYGPNYEVDVLERGADRFPGTESYRDSVPGELRGNR
jgi:hypothetical protein